MLLDKTMVWIPGVWVSGLGCGGCCGLGLQGDWGFMASRRYGLVELRCVGSVISGGISVMIGASSEHSEP